MAMLPLHSGRLPSVADGCFAPNLVSGIPDWAFSMLMWCLFFVGVLMYVIYLLPGRTCYRNRSLGVTSYQIEA